MAEMYNSMVNDSIDSSQMSLSELRALAQSHLQSIDHDIATETQQQLTARQESLKYLKPCRKTRSKSPQTTAADTGIELVKGPKLRSAQDIIHRLRWDPSVRLEDYHVGYLERFEGIKEMPVSMWIKESTHEDFIPLHRIKYVKRRGFARDEMVWDRKAKIDKVFGSGPQTGLDDGAGLR